MQVASATTGRRRSVIQSRPREAFGPRPGHLWYLPDYSQIEVWIFSFMAEEKVMIDALMSGYDFHGTVAQTVWGHLPKYEEEKSYWRKRAKLVMFTILYGGGIQAVADQLRCSYEDAAKFFGDYDSRFPGIKRFMRRMSHMAERQGYVENPFGRHYEVPPGLEYKMTNYEIQGTAADIIKGAKIYVDRMLTHRWPNTHLLMTIHDELVVEVPYEDHSKRLMREIIYEMQRESIGVLGLPIRLPVSMKIVTFRWSEAREIDVKDSNLRGTRC